MERTTRDTREERALRHELEDDRRAERKARQKGLHTVTSRELAMWPLRLPCPFSLLHLFEVFWLSPGCLGFAHSLARPAISTTGFPVLVEEAAGGERKEKLQRKV